MIGFGDIAGKIGGALNSPAVKNTLSAVGKFGNTLGGSTAFGAAPAPQPTNGLSDVRPMQPPPQTGNVGDIFRNFANNRMAAKTATNVGKGPGAGFGSPDVAVGLGAIR